MKITDYVDLFYPSAEAEEYAKKRQKNMKIIRRILWSILKRIT